MILKIHVLKRILTVFLFAAPALSFSQIRIMPLGDSITRGDGEGVEQKIGYRKHLWNLVTERFEVNFVGTMEDSDGDFDGDHEGHSGWRADEIAEFVTDWQEQTDPEVILFQIGTNDISAGRTVEKIIADIETTLNRIWAKRSNVHVFLSSVTPRTDGKGLNAKTEVLNAEILRLTEEKRFKAPVVFVDPYAAITAFPDWAGTLMQDAVHPNAAGYRIMAETLFPHLENLFSPVNPVELAAFSATVVQDRVTLFWQTQSESRNFGFYIEHKFGQSSFQKIGFVEGGGTTSLPRSYTFKTNVLSPGEHAFRLKQVDTNGEFSLSEARQIQISVPDRFSVFPIYPNPFRFSSNLSRGLNISFHLPKKDVVSTQIFDMLGRKVRSFSETVFERGRHTLIWDGKRDDGQMLPSGAYLVRIAAGGEAKSQRVFLLR